MTLDACQFDCLPKCPKKQIFGLSKLKPNPNKIPKSSIFCLFWGKNNDGVILYIMLNNRNLDIILAICTATFGGYQKKLVFGRVGVEWQFGQISTLSGQCLFAQITILLQLDQKNKKIHIPQTGLSKLQE